MLTSLRALGLWAVAMGAAFALAGPAQAQSWTLNINDAGHDPMAAGGTVAYAVRIDNDSHALNPATALVFTIPAPAIFAGATSDDGLVCAPDSGLGPLAVTCAVPEIAAQTAIEARFNVIAPAAGTITVEAAIPGEAAVFEVTTIDEGADLSVTLTGDTERTAGEITNFTATLTNHGPHGSTSDARLTLAVPAGLSLDFTTIPPACTLTAALMTCTPGALAVGESADFAFATQVTAENASNITIPVAVLGNAPRDPIPGNDNDTLDIDVAAGTDVSLVKTRGPLGPLLVGDTVTFTLTPRHVGSMPVVAEIADTLPANYAFDSVDFGAGWICPDMGQTLRCTFDAASDPGADYGAPITITATAVAPGAAVTNTATIAMASDVNPANNTADDGSAHIAMPEVDLVAIMEGPPRGLVVVGQTYDFELSARNAGNAPFYGDLTLTDHLPAGLTVTGFTPPAGWHCLHAGAPLPAELAGPAAIVCTTGQYTDTNPLMPGASTPVLTLPVRVTQEGVLSNVLNVSAPDPSYPDRATEPSTNSDVFSGDGPNVTDVAVIKTLATPGPFVSGTAATFDIALINHGPVAARDVRLEDRLRDIVFADAADPGAIVVAPAGMTCEITPNRASFHADLVCTLPELPVCTTDCPVVSVTVLVGDAGDKTNTATVYSLATPDPVISNNSSDAAYSVTAQTDVTVEKTSATPEGSMVRAGQELVYVITASVPRDGRSGAENVVITDTLPHDVRFVSATPSVGMCTTAPAAGSLTIAGNDQLICALGPIDNGS